MVAASADAAPALVAEVYGHSLTRSRHSARAAQRRLVWVVSACERYGLPSAGKSAASAAGLCRPTPALAGYGLSREDAGRLRAELVGLGAVRPGR